MRQFLTLFFGLALITLFVVTLAGLLAPLFSPFDLINQLRLHVLETAAALILVFALLRARRLAIGALALALLNLALAAPAFALVARVEDGEPALKLVALNVWGRNAEPGRIETFLRRQDADLVLLLEAGETMAPMLERIKDLYPHRADCMQQRQCRLVLLSKRPMIEPRVMPRSQANPPAIVARFKVDGRGFTFYGVHLARPFGFDWQRRDVDALIAALGSIPGPLILAGDLNATPWSWTMMRLSLATGMARGRTFGATWPARPPLSPQFLIDHVMTRGGIGIVDARSAGPIGSDHLPTVAEISLR